jgi:RNA-binding protein
MENPMLSQDDKKQLKARAHHLDPVVMIGDAGLSDAVMREIDIALKSHELIKVRMLGDDRDARHAAGQAICAATGADLVQYIGKLIVLFRPRPPEEKKAAKPARPRGPRRTKKQEGARAALRPAPRR